MKYLLVILCSVIVMPLMAQHTLSGTVVSKTDGAPVEMATIRLFAYPKTHMPAPPAGMPTPPEGMSDMPMDMPDSILVQGAQTTYDGMFVFNNIRLYVIKMLYKDGKN